MICQDLLLMMFRLVIHFMFLDGSFVYVLGITSITSVVGPTIVFVANDPNDAGVSLPTGQAAIIRPTLKYKNLPPYISGLRDDLRSAVI